MPDEKKRFNNAFAALSDLRQELPPGQEPEAPPTSDPPRASVPARAVVRREKKGRRGKVVTVVQQLGLSADEAEGWLRELKQTLGCGGAVEGEELVFQGDHRKRLKVLLEKRGVRRVSIG